MLAHELVHKIRKHKERNDLMMVKLDMQKAYDRLE